MDSSFFLNIAHDALFAAIAGIGFAMVMAPKRRALPFIALIAALGHSLRFVLQESALAAGITLASFGAALAIGFVSVPLAKRIKCPAGSLAFPALLPMIPGMYAYKAVLALVRFCQTGVSHEPQLADFIVAFFYNGLTTLFVMSALVIGILIPIQFFRRIHYTRGAMMRG